MHQELFGRVAHARALYLGIHHNRLGQVRFRRPVDIDEANAGVMLDDGNGAVFRHEPDQFFAAAGNDAMDVCVQFEHRRERGAVGRGYELHRVSRQSGLPKRGADQRRQRRIRVENLLAAAQDGGVPGFKAKDGAIHGDVWPRLIDDADHADRHPDLANAEPVGPAPLLKHIAHRVRKNGNLAHRFGQAPEADRIQGETVDLGRGESAGGGGIEVLPVGGHQLPVRGVDCVREAAQGGVLRRGRRVRQHQRRGAGALRYAGYKLGQVGGHERSLNHTFPQKHLYLIRFGRKLGIRGGASCL